jgi:hypothetical protein
VQRRPLPPAPPRMSKSWHRLRRPEPSIADCWFRRLPALLHLHAEQRFHVQFVSCSPQLLRQFELPKTTFTQTTMACKMGQSNGRFIMAVKMSMNATVCSILLAFGLTSPIVVQAGCIDGGVRSILSASERPRRLLPYQIHWEPSVGYQKQFPIPSWHSVPF